MSFTGLVHAAHFSLPKFCLFAFAVPPCRRCLPVTIFWGNFASPANVGLTGDVDYCEGFPIYIYNLYFFQYNTLYIYI